MFDEFLSQVRSREDSRRGPINPYSAMTEGTKRQLFEQWARMFYDPIEFLKAVRTLDESASANNSIRAFPYQLDYIQFFVRCLQRMQRIAVPKSRRMKISWSCLAFITWDSMFHRGRRTACVSKKEEDSDQLVERCHFIMNHLDESVFPKEIRPQVERTFCRMEFPELISQINGYPSGADQLRQYTFSRIFGDEFAFWPNAEEMYVGAKPTIEASDSGPGGQIVLVSSRSPGFFKRLVYDRMDEKNDFIYEVAQAELNPDSPMQGVELWKNPKNKFNIVDIHYTADPAKRTIEWIEREKSGLPLNKWNREYEKSWDSYEGLPVFGDFVQSKHGARNLRPHPGLPLLRGWDFGLTPSCIVAQQQENQLVVLREFQEFNMGTDRFSDIVLPRCQLLYPGYQFIDFVDPAGMNRDQSDEGQATAILDGKGLMCIPGEIAFEKRRKAIEHFLLGYSPRIGQPNLIVDIANCPILVRGFNGGYRYSDSVLDKEPNKLAPLKDEHCVDLATEILTLDGWKRFDELTIGQSIYEHDLASGELMIGELKGVNVFKGQRQAFRVGNSFHEMYYTAKHRCLVKNKQQKVVFVTPSDLKQGHRFMAPFALSEPPKKRDFTEEFIRICGWVCAEGYYRASGKSIRLYQSKTANSAYCRDLSELLSRYPGTRKMPERANDSRTEWNITGELAYMIRLMMPDKCPSALFINKMSNCDRRLFLYEFMRGDGSWGKKVTSPGRISRKRDFFTSGKCVRAFQKRRDVTNALQHMACLAGMTSSIKYKATGHMFTLLPSGQYLDYANTDITSVIIDGAWCPTTTTGTWVMRSKGRVYLTGNSHPQDALQMIASGVLNNRRPGHRAGVSRRKNVSYSSKHETDPKPKTRSYYGT